jgi:hypothetical protein
LLGISEATFRDWVDKFRIPNRRPGNDIYVDAVALRTHLPVRYWEE